MEAHLFSRPLAESLNQLHKAANQPGTGVAVLPHEWADDIRRWSLPNSHGSHVVYAVENGSCQETICVVVDAPFPLTQQGLIFRMGTADDAPFQYIQFALGEDAEHPTVRTSADRGRLDHDGLVTLAHILDTVNAPVGTPDPALAALISLDRE